MKTVWRKSRRNSKWGFTLMEAVVSVAVFAIAAVLFATILFTATNMVNLSLVYDRDRVALMEAIETGSRSDIEITVKNKDGEGYETFTVKLSNDASTVKYVDGEYFIYTAPSGRQYCIFLEG